MRWQPGAHASREYPKVVAERDALQARLAEAERLLRRAVDQSARVHPDFMAEIQQWLSTADREDVCR